MLNPRLQRLHEFGLECIQHSKWEQAVRCYKAITVIMPEHAASWFNLALALHEKAEIHAAWRPIRRALEFFPDDVETLSLAARVGLELGHFEQALIWIDQAISLDSSNPDLELLQAETFRISGAFDQAALALSSAAQKGADNTDLALQFCELYRSSEQINTLTVALNELINSDPENVPAKLQYAESLLSQGNYADGWPRYESRLNLPGKPILRDYPWPYWQGAPLQDKTILVYAEQGIGDEIMFASCLPDLLKAVQKVLFVCDDRLATLFKHSLPQIETLSFSDVPNIAVNQPRPIDYCVAIGSLPLHFRPNADQFPAYNSYLRADEAWIQPWREKLQTLGNGLKIGIAWQGGLMRTGQLTRSLQPEQLLPLLELPGINFMNIQHGKVRRELEWLAEKRNLPVITWPLDTKNMSELAGLVSALDLIITPCCSLVHLAGALGKPVWVMTPKVAAWRYLNEGETMPWYPSARLFRQPESGDWASVIDSIRQQLLANGNNQFT